MEYSLDLTEEGKQRHKHSGSYQSPYSTSHKSQDSLKTPWYISAALLVGVAFFVYKIYRSCVAQHQYSTTESDYPPDPGHQRFGSGTSGRGGSPRDPPPPYPADSSGFPGASCGGQNAQAPPGAARGGGGPGFWSGMGAGGALGYLFGRNTGYGGGGMFGGGYARQPQYNPSYGGGSYGGGFGGGGSSSSGGSSGSREASGFGGTRRR